MELLMIKYKPYHNIFVENFFLFVYKYQRINNKMERDILEIKEIFTSCLKG